MGSGSSKQDSDEVIESDDSYAVIKNWQGEVSRLMVTGFFFKSVTNQLTRMNLTECKASRCFFVSRSFFSEKKTKTLPEALTER